MLGLPGDNRIAFEKASLAPERPPARPRMEDLAIAAFLL